MFYLHNFNLRRAFNLFDTNADGKLSKKEFHEGWNQLGLGLTMFEIDELYEIVDADKSGEINQDEFIKALAQHVNNVDSPETQERIKDSIFMKIKTFTDTSSLSLADLMSPYDP